MASTILIRGGGDLASGAALRLKRAGLQILITELAHPLAVRRLVSFAEAVHSKAITIEGIQGRLATTLEECQVYMQHGEVPVLIDPDGAVISRLQPLVVVDARMTKLAPEIGIDTAPLVIGLGPGFIAGKHCHAVIETKRGPFLGRVFWNGSAEEDSGQPDMVGQHQSERVLRAPTDGTFKAHVKIGEALEAEQIIAEVEGQPIYAAFSGVLRGLIHNGMSVQKGLKVGDLDPRMDLSLARLVSEKSLTIGGAVLEAILTKPEIRMRLWEA